MTAALVPLRALEDREAALGAQMAGEIRKQMHVVTDPSTRLYVSELVTRIVGRNYPVNLEIIESRSDDEPAEPVWLVGHYVFVPTALIRNARSEAEFAGMLAHSLAHEKSGDYLKAKQAPGTIPLYMIGGDGPSRLRLPHTQDEQRERAADSFAAAFLHEAGYDPAALLQYVERLHARETERISELELVVAGMTSASHAVLDTSSFQRIKDKYPAAEKARFVPSLSR